MAYDNSSYNGDMLCKKWDKENNPMNPPSSAGWFHYINDGTSFDDIDDLISQLRLDNSPYTCDSSLLNAFARDKKVIRDPAWSEDEYRAVICLETYVHILRRGLKNILNKLRVVGVTPETGDILVEKAYSGFRASNEFITNELTSDKFIMNDSLEVATDEGFIVKVPDGVNTDLVQFICDYVPYNCQMIEYESL